MCVTMGNGDEQMMAKTIVPTEDENEKERKKREEKEKIPESQRETWNAGEDNTYEDMVGDVRKVSLRLERSSVFS